MRSALFCYFFLFFLFSFRMADAQEKDSTDRQLILAAYNGDINQVNQLIADSADVNACNDEGISALMYASEKGYAEIVKILLYHNANPDLKPANGRTALISAAIHNYQEIVYLLLIYGADINAADEYGVTALIYAASYNLPDMAVYLLKNGAQHVIKAQDGTDALLAAACFGNTDMVDLLCRQNADISTRDSYGFTPLTIAIQNNDLRLADTILKNSPELKTHFKEYPSLNLIDYARIYNRRLIVKKLKNQGLHGSVWPFFNKITLNYNMASFNTEDCYMGAGIGISDAKYNLSFELGFNGRIAKKRVLEQQSENIFYQLWEKRKVIYLDIEKLIGFKTKKTEHRQGIYIRAKGLFTFGSYEGLNRKPNSHFTFSPGIGYSYLFRTFFVKAGYEYCDLGVYHGMKHWIMISAGVSINLTKNLRKTIYWI